MMRQKKKLIFINRVVFLIFSSILIVLIITVKLVYLQVVKYDYYLTVAQKAHLGYTELPARRGEILTQDYHSGELFKLATNITLDLLFADPTLIKDKRLVAETIAPLIFDIKEEKVLDFDRMKKLWAEAKNDEERNKVSFLTDEELFENYKDRLEEQLSQELRKNILLEENLSDEIVETLKRMNISGVKVLNNQLWVAPSEILDLNKTAEALSSVIDISKADLRQILKGKNRYVVLRKKLDPDISNEIKKILKNDKDKNFIGIGLKENYYRFYPENVLASQVIGFVDNQMEGRYGIEETFQAKLKGKTGIFSSQKDASGKQITVGESIIRPAVDGDNIILTIDRAIQMEVEKILKKGVVDMRADSGQILIMNPQTGRIITMAQYPTFNPNLYGNVFDKEEIKLTTEEVEKLIPLDNSTSPKYFKLIVDKGRNIQFEVFKQEDEDGSVKYFVYKNKVGPKVYRNTSISDIYEPGSVFKIITMSAAIDDHDVTPNTTTYVGGPIEVDCVNGKCDYEIRNALDKYPGTISMTQVLEKSDNIGISFVARKLGRTLFYSYMKKFGFGERTDIELDNEHPGTIEFFEKWSESELLTHGFGQGIATTPIQIVSAFCAIANGGKLMQPYIVDRIEHEDGKKTQTEPKIIRQVITKESSETILSMMVSAVENGVARAAKVNNHLVAGKTGTSQTYKKGKALKGAGTTIASFVGIGPVDKPKFVVLVKLDYPRSSEWGSDTAAPLFSKIAEYLFNYYNIPPDK